MDVTRVAFVLLAGISMIFVAIRLINRVMERRDRPSQFIFSVLMVVALIIFMIWLLVTPQGPSCGNAFNGWTCASPNP